jgi:hypothetical protein
MIKGVGSQAGLPPRWESIAAHLESTTGRHLALGAPPEAFSAGSQEIEVRLDGELLGSFEYRWDDNDPQGAVDGLRAVLSVYLDEELGREDW